jgi:hypothetical protein
VTTAELAAIAAGISIDTSHLDGTQITVAFLGGTAVVSAAAITAVATVINARRSGRIEQMLTAVISRQDRSDARHDRSDERIDDIESLPVIATQLHIVHAGRVPRQHPVADT